jgi:hypothetical protein
MRNPQGRAKCVRKGKSEKLTDSPAPQPSVSQSGSEGGEDGVVRLALEAYKLASLTQTVLNQFDPTEARKYGSRLAFVLRNIQEILQESDLRIVSLEGVPFDEGLAISAVNLSEFDSHDDLIIDRVLEPLIMGSQGIVHSGIVSLRKKES